MIFKRKAPMLRRRNAWAFDWLSDLESRFEVLESQRLRALSAEDAAQAKADLRQVVMEAGNELSREREARAELLATVEAYRAEITQLRAAVGAAIGIELSS
jgi:hypothetical protein